MLKLSMPKKSIMQCSAAAAVAVAVLSWLRLRPLGIFFLAVFCFWYYKTQSNWRIVPPPELEKMPEILIHGFHDWRTNKPKVLILVGILITILAVVVNHYIASLLLLYIGIVLIPFVFCWYEIKILRVDRRQVSPPPLHEELDDEFLPEENAINLVLLARASDISAPTSATEDADEEERSDEIPSELLIPDSIPEIDETSTDEDDELLPTTSKASMLHTQRGDHSNDSQAGSSQSGDAILFKKGHFKRDSPLSTSSSSSEESLSKGLQFPDVTAVDGHSLHQLPALEPATETQTVALLASSSKLLPNLVSDIVQWSIGATAAAKETPTPAPALATVQGTQTQRHVTALDSSDESDFEILDKDDEDEESK